ncbi:MAG TPA: pilus assembly protein TadG-related protein, partial [Candidatus Binatia bacterium]|nr:pilus assembly protein TadG-related protein [Candidatus Binatia bacterium]
MTRALPTIDRWPQRGQILVLTALMMVILIAITGLAIDISAAYMADRWQRSVADEAALAGAQDLQIPGSRQLPGPGDY